MKGLAVAALVFYAIHKDIFRRHKRHFLKQVFFHNGGINPHAGNNIKIKVQYPVRGKKCFRKRNSAVCGIVKGPLKPLGGGGHRRICKVADYIAGKRGNTLASHRVALISHCGGADLLCFKRLVNLFEMGKQTNVPGKFR